MTQREKLARAKMSLIELAEYLKNVSEACRVMGVSRQHFYDIKKAYADGGMPALQEKSRRKPNFKNRVAPEIEAAVVRTAEEYPAYGQLRAANELRKSGVLISPCGVRSIWLRHGLETFKKRLIRLEETGSPRRDRLYGSAVSRSGAGQTGERNRSGRDRDASPWLPDRPGHPVRGLPQGSGADLSADGD